MPLKDPQTELLQEADTADFDEQQLPDELLPVDVQDGDSADPLEMVAPQEAPEHPIPETFDKIEKVSGISAGKAFLVFLGYIIGQILGSLVVAFAAGVLAALQGTNLTNPLEKAAFARNMMAPSLFGGMVGGILVMFALALILLRGHLREHSHRGAAWRLGTFRQWLVGFFIGGIISLASLFVISWVFPPDNFQQTGPLAQMAMTPGLPRMTWFILALLLAPVVEELLFRGIVFAGFCRWLGVIGGGIVSTFLFVLLHVPEVMYYWPAVLGITAIAIAALVMRLRTAAVGPAVATHFAYNLVVALLVAISFG